MSFSLLRHSLFFVCFQSNAVLWNDNSSQILISEVWNRGRVALSNLHSLLDLIELCCCRSTYICYLNFKLTCSLQRQYFCPTFKAIALLVFYVPFLFDGSDTYQFLYTSILWRGWILSSHSHLSFHFIICYRGSSKLFFSNLNWFHSSLWIRQ